MPSYPVNGTIFGLSSALPTCDLDSEPPSQVGEGFTGTLPAQKYIEYAARSSSEACGSHTVADSNAPFSTLAHCPADFEPTTPDRSPATRQLVGIGRFVHRLPENISTIIRETVAPDECEFRLNLYFRDGDYEHSFQNGRLHVPSWAGRCEEDVILDRCRDRLKAVASIVLQPAWSEIQKRLIIGAAQLRGLTYRRFINAFGAEVMCATAVPWMSMRELLDERYDAHAVVLPSAIAAKTVHEYIWERYGFDASAPPIVSQGERSGQVSLLETALLYGYPLARAIQDQQDAGMNTPQTVVLQNPTENPCTPSKNPARKFSSKTPRKKGRGRRVAPKQLLLSGLDMASFAEQQLSSNPQLLTNHGPLLTDEDVAAQTRHGQEDSAQARRVKIIEKQIEQLAQKLEEAVQGSEPISEGVKNNAISEAANYHQVMTLTQKQMVSTNSQKLSDIQLIDAVDIIRENVPTAEDGDAVSKLLLLQVVSRADLAITQCTTHKPSE